MSKSGKQEHREKFIDYKDKIICTDHYMERVGDRSDLKVSEAIGLVRDGICKGVVKKSISSQGGEYFVSNNGIHIMDLDGDTIVLITYYKTERQMRMEAIREQEIIKEKEDQEREKKLAKESIFKSNKEMLEIEKRMQREELMENNRGARFVDVS